MQTKLSVFCEKVIEAGWLAALILVPVFFNIYSARTFEPDKLTLMRSITLVMLLAWLVKVVEVGLGRDESDEEEGPGEPGPSRQLGQSIQRVLRTPLFLPVLLLALAYIISTILSISPQVALWGSYQRMQGTYTALSYIVIFALLAAHLRTRAQTDRLVTTIILTSLPVGLYGIIQHYGLDPLPWAGDVVSRVAANLGNAIFVASYLIMAIPLTLARLLDSMAAILNEEKASWGHTVLAAVYIFILAVDVITVIFSQSRGPQLGLLAGLFFFGLLGLLSLYRRYGAATPVTLGDALRSLLDTIAPLGLGGVAGLIWFQVAGRVSVAGSSLDVWACVGLGILLGAVLNVLIIVVRVVAHRGWSRLLLNWAFLAIFMAGFIAMLNVPESPFLGLRPIPVLGRMTELFQPGEGTGRVRVLIWDGVIRLISPHDALGIPGEFTDTFNIIRPLIGYGPESMFNAFAKVYPPGLAHIEARGSSADRSHNETFDVLATLGILGFLAFYFLMFSLIYYLLKMVGWVPDKAARRRLLVLLGIGGLLGALLPPVLTGTFTFSGVGLPAGILFMMFIYLIWQALAGTGAAESARDGGGADEQDETPAEPKATREALLLIGVFTALMAHFVETHFVFSIAATYVYFWIYAGVVVAWARGASSPTEETPLAATERSVEAAQAESDLSQAERSRRRRRRRKSAAQMPGLTDGALAARYPTSEDWETWLGVLGLVVAIILIAMVFDFVTTQFDPTRGNFSLLWMFGITWGMGLAVGLGEIAVRAKTWQKPINWARASLIFVVTSLGYSFFYLMVHRWQLRPRNVVATNAIQAVFEEASIILGAYFLFYVFVGLLVLLIATMLALPHFRRQPAWRTANWWLYPILILATGAAIVSKNMDVVQADMYLKQGEQWRGQGQYDKAIQLHTRARDLDPDEDFYDLALAMDYQLKGQDNSLSVADRMQIWSQGETAAVDARRINPYNPDNTGNMGRYYLTWAQLTPTDDPQRAVRFQKALDFFEKAMKLAPQNVVYYNLLAQTYYILGQFDQAVKVLQASVALDASFDQTQMLLGDTYAAMSRPDEAAQAHAKAIALSPGAFADQFLSQRLNFYASIPPTTTGTITPMQRIISAFTQAEAADPNNALIPRTLGLLYDRIGDHQKSLAYYEQATQLGDNQAAMAMADDYLNQQDYEKAISLYETLIPQNPQNAQAHRNLGYAYAKVGRLADAIQENLTVLQIVPNDYVSMRNLALLYRDSDKLPEAVQQAEKLIAATPDNEKGVSYLLLGSLYAQTGKATEAVGAYKQAGALYLQQNRATEAVQPFQAALQLAPDDYTLHQQLAMAFQQLGRYDDALAEADRSLSLAPESAREALQQLIDQIKAKKG
jgi:tetratricopeptide (TPR) repeat protein